MLLRITSGNQFGMEKEEAYRIIQSRDHYKNVIIQGFQMYSGTQKKKIRTIEKELARLEELIAKCERELGFRTAELEYGPGLPVNYFADDGFDEEGMLHSFAAALEAMSYAGHITVEMGRFAASSCGYYLTSVGDIKTHKEQNILITDGGNHQLKYFGQNMGMRTPKYEYLRSTGGLTSLRTDFSMQISGGAAQASACAGSDSAAPSWDVYGALCTVHDVIAKELPIDGPHIGDCFVFKNIGAYSVTEGMALFLSRDLPLILSYSEEAGVQVLRKRMAASEINCPGQESESTVLYIQNRENNN